MLIAEDQKLQREDCQRLKYRMYDVRYVDAVLSSKKWSILDVIEHGEVLLLWSLYL